MAWIKRNLFFVIGSVVALGLMGFGIYLLLAQINDENQITTEIQGQYVELTRLSGQKPHPGNDKIDNIAEAKRQRKALEEYIKKERGVFQPIPSIPDATAGKVSNADFSRELRNTVAQLRHSAHQQSVQLPPDYYFTFEAQKRSLIFSPGTLEPLASHLGEVKALCDILFAAKINFLDNIQREIVSTNQDLNPPDYLATKKTASTPLADLTPYQVTFRCFSADLAQVLARLATSPYGFMVESINVEPANSLMAGAFDPFQNPQAGPQPFPPGVNGQPQSPGREGRIFPGAFPPPAAPLVAPAPSTARITTFLNEKPFRVTLLVQVVKIKSAK